MKVKIISAFKDAKNGKQYNINDEVEFTKARIKEIQDVEKTLGFKLIEVIEAQSKTTKKKGA